MLEIMRLLGCYLLLTFPLGMCVLAGTIYGIGIKIGVFHEE